MSFDALKGACVAKNFFAARSAAKTEAGSPRAAPGGGADARGGASEAGQRDARTPRAPRILGVG